MEGGKQDEMSGLRRREKKNNLWRLSLSFCAVPSRRRLHGAHTPSSCRALQTAPAASLRTWCSRRPRWRHRRRTSGWRRPCRTCPSYFFYVFFDIRPVPPHRIIIAQKPLFALRVLLAQVCCWLALSPLETGRGWGGGRGSKKKSSSSCSLRPIGIPALASTPVGMWKEGGGESWFAAAAAAGCEKKKGETERED